MVGAGATALGALLPASSDAAGFLFLAGTGTAFSGGKSQLNLNSVVQGGEYPFLNMMKGTNTWSLQDGSGSVSPSLLDGNGYPLDPGGSHSLTNGGFTKNLWLPSQASRSANYVIMWTGTMSFTCTGASGTQSGTNGRVSLGAIAGQITLNVLSVTGSVSNIILCQTPDDEALLAAGHVFNTQFKQHIINAKIGVIRFLNWGGNISVNNSMQSRWSQRKPTTYVAYGTQMQNPNMLGGVTTSSENAFSLSAPTTWGGLVDKATVIGQFDPNGNANVTISGTTLTVNSTSRTTISVGDCVTGPGGTLTNGGVHITALVSGTGGTGTYTLNTSPGSIGPENVFITSPTAMTLNVGSTGAVSCVAYNNVSNQFNTQTPYPGRYFTAVWDQDLNIWIKRGGDADSGNYFFDNGVPPEIMLQLCIECGCHPWFVVPVYTCDPLPTLGNDGWLANLAAYCKANAPAWMIPRYEVVPNEHWGTTTAFGYGEAKANAHWGVSSADEWAGQLGYTGGAQLQSTYGGRGSGYQAVTGLQTYANWNNGVPANTNGQRACLESTQYVAHGGTAANTVITHVCIADYFHGNWPNSSTVSAIAGTIADNGDGTGTLTVTSLTASDGLTNNTLFPGCSVSGSGVASPTYIIGWNASDGTYTGTGGLGTYKVSTNAGTVSGASNTYTTALAAYAATSAAAIPQAYIDSNAPTVVVSAGNRFFNADNLVANVIPWYVNNWLPAHNGGNTIKLNFYEGGYDGRGEAYVTNEAAFVFATKFIASLVTFTSNVYNGAITAGAEFPSHFQYGGANNGFSASNTWAAWDPDIYASSVTATWQAIAAFNGGTYP